MLRSVMSWTVVARPAVNGAHGFQLQFVTRLHQLRWRQLNGVRCMATMMFFTQPQVERLTGLSRSTVRRWQDIEVFSPEYPERVPFSGPFQRIYTFRDVVGLRTLALLRSNHRIGLEEIRKVGAFLKGHSTTPWSSMRFWVVNGHVAFKDPGTRTAMAGGDGQLVINEVFLEPIAHQVEQESRAFRERAPHTIGQISRSRNIMSNQWVVAGTRIPTHIIKEYHDNGYSTAEIIAEYPDLSPEDIQAALKHEEQLHRDAA